MGKRSARSFLVLILSLILLAASVVPVLAAGRSTDPVTYLNANFGPPNETFINFYRSRGIINFESDTASVLAKAKAFEVAFSASAAGDPNETSSGFSSYDVGTVRVGPPGGTCTAGTAQGLCSVTVTPRTLSLSGSANFCMNLWFDSNHDGEYFAWENNQFSGFGAGLGDAYAAGTCSDGALTIDETTVFFFTSNGGCPGGATLDTINSGLCTNIPANTNVAIWVGIDIGAGTTGQGSATI